MTRGPLSVRQLDDASLRGLLDEQSKLDLTYCPVGITDQARAVHGYHYVHDEIELGSGQETFERAVRAIQEWKVHERIGMSVTSQVPLVKENVDVVFQLRYYGLYITIACRVVKVTSDENTWGFAYGTLPHHVERGEELFVVEHATDDTVWFKVRAHSRPGRPLVRMGSPVARHVQKVITARYLRAMKELVGEAS